MSRKRKYDGPPFVMIEKPLLKSEAWLALSHAARVSYLHLKLQISHATQREIVLTYRTMEALMQRRTYAKALRELEKVGLVQRSQRGGLYRRVNIFVLSQDWKKYKAPQLRESGGQVAEVQPSQVAEVPQSETPEQPSGGKSATCLEINL